MKKLLLGLLFLATSIGNVAFAQNPYLEKLKQAAQDPNNPYVLVEAHRAGWGKMIPENSLLGIKRAIAEGVDELEIDIRLTKDNHLVLMHDSTMDRTTTLSGPVGSLTLAEFQKAKLRRADYNVTQFTPPTLDQALAEMKDKVLFRLDIKCGKKCVKEVYKHVAAHGEMYQATADRLSYPIFHQYYKGDDSKFISLGGNYTDYQTAKDLPKGVDWIWIKDFDGKKPPLKKINEFAPHVRLFMMPYQDERSGGHGDMISLFNPDNGWGWLVDHHAKVILSNEPVRLMNYLEKRGLRHF